MNFYELLFYLFLFFLFAFVFLLVRSWAHEGFHIVAGKIKGVNVVGLGFQFKLFPNYSMFPLDHLGGKVCPIAISGPIGTLVGGTFAGWLFSLFGIIPYMTWFGFFLSFIFMLGRDLGDLNKARSTSEAVSKSNIREEVEEKVDQWSNIFIISSERFENWMASLDFDKDVGNKLQEKAGKL